MTTNTKAQKGYKGIGMDGVIATWYARNTGKNLEEFRVDARKIAAEITDGSDILEVAPGPGYLSIELSRLGRYHITGMDISQSFVDIAQANARAAGVDVTFRQGDAGQMPFDDATFDYVYCRSAFKNFSQPVRAIDEMYRVLRPGGKARIRDLRGDVSMETINRYVDTMGVNWWNRLMTRSAFRFMLIKRAYTTAQFRDFVAKSRFGTCEIVTDDIGLEVRMAKTGN